MNLAFRLASCRKARNFSCPARLRITSAIIERAELPVHRNKHYTVLFFTSLRTFISPMRTFVRWSTTARRIAYRSFNIAEFRVAIAAIGDEKRNQRSDAFDIGPVDYDRPSRVPLTNPDLARMPSETTSVVGTPIKSAIEPAGRPPGSAA